MSRRTGGGADHAASELANMSLALVRQLPGFLIILRPCVHGCVRGLYMVRGTDVVKQQYVRNAARLERGLCSTDYVRAIMPIAL